MPNSEPRDDRSGVDDTTSASAAPALPESGSPAGKSRGFGSYVAFAGGILIAVLAMLFVLSNGQPVTVAFLGWDAQVPLWLVILASLLLGALLVLMVQGGRKASRKLRRSQKTE